MAPVPSLAPPPFHAPPSPWETFSLTPSPSPTISSLAPSPSATPSSSLAPSPSITPSASLAPSPSPTPSSSLAPSPSPSPTPSSSLAPSPSLTRSPSAASLVEASAAAGSSTTLLVPEHLSNKITQAANSAGKKRGRDDYHDARRAGYQASDIVTAKKQRNLDRKQVAKAEPVEAPDASADRFQTSPNGWAGFKGQRNWPAVLPNVAEYVRRGYRYIRWNGRFNVPILDARGRIVAYLLGIPGVDTENGGLPYILAMREVTQLLRVLIAAFPRHFPWVPKGHRRGLHSYVNTGYSMGGGQEVPTNFRIPTALILAIEALLHHPAVKRHAQHTSNGLRTMFRLIYDWYLGMQHATRERYPDLDAHNASSPFPAMTLNMGPRVACNPHVDHANPAYGVCAITALGVFNDEYGGQLVLDDLRLVIQFPANTTIYIPSASVEHHNLPVHVGEERYSLVQYGAAGLFRWWQNGFQSAVDYQKKRDAGVMPKELNNEHDVSTKLKKFSQERDQLDADQRIWEGVQRFTRWEELQRDRFTRWEPDNSAAERYEDYSDLGYAIIDDVQHLTPELDDDDDDDKMEGPSSRPYDPECYKPSDS